MNSDEIVLGTRAGVGLFDMNHRGFLEVRGEDRVRWLDGMISGDVQALEDAASGAGCYAVLLTNRGAIVADLHVARLGETYLLEAPRVDLPRIRETLERYLIADDVVLEDRSAEFSTFGLEGPTALDVLSEATEGRIAELGPECWVESTIADRKVLVASFGFSGERGFQIRCEPEESGSVEAALVAAAEATSLVRGDFESLEILRIEAGIPRLGAELDEEVLPPEARLEHAISTTKGCYVGQEIVARLRARGQVNHLLVGLRLGSEALPPIGAELKAGERVTGELTSVAISPSEGPIALGFVRRDHAEPGTVIEILGVEARVSALPFIAGLSVATEASTTGAPN
jgi:folate-binding protein YgfZ